MSHFKDIIIGEGAIVLYRIAMRRISVATRPFQGRGPGLVPASTRLTLYHLLLKISNAGFRTQFHQDILGFGGRLPFDLNSFRAA
jgi:hypothetical protein